MTLPESVLTAVGAFCMNSIVIPVCCQISYPCKMSNLRIEAWLRHVLQQLIRTGIPTCFACYGPRLLSLSSDDCT
jgi:hypothetical protein